MEFNIMQNNIKERNDAFDEVAAIFAASGVEITPAMLERMSPLLRGDMSFEQHCAALKAELEEVL